MSTFFFLCFLFIFPALLIAGLIKPSWFDWIFRGNSTRKKTSLLFGAGIFISFFISFGLSPSSRTPTTQEQIDVLRANNPRPVVATPEAAPPPKPRPGTSTREWLMKQASQPADPSMMSATAAQKELDDIVALGKQAHLISSYEFSDYASAVYIDYTWYTQKVSFKKDMLAKIAQLKKAITGYQHFEVRDAYSNELVGEVTSFTGSIEVYK